MLPLSVIVAFGVAFPAASQAADTFTVKNIQFPVKVGPDNATSCTIDADLYVPNDASPANPAAAILATNGFGGSKDDFDTLAPSMAKRGYVFLAYSGLGFGGPDQSNQSHKGSTCKIELDDPDWDGKAASQLINYLGSLNYVIHDPVDHVGVHETNDPRVGMIGGSYGGEIQFAAADVDKRLDTIIPQITWNDLSYSLAPNGTAQTRGVTYADAAPGVEKYEWTSLFFGLGIVDGLSGTFGQQDPSHFAGQCPNFDDNVCQSKAKMDATGFPDQTTLDFAHHASVESYMQQIKIPTFLAQGEDDTLFNLNEAVATYNALRAQGTPVKMLWKSAGHSGGDLGNSEYDEANPEAAYASRQYLAWFDYYLRGVGDPPTLDFSYYRDWVPFPAGKDAAPAVATAPSYPAGADQPWYLSGSGDLVSATSAIKAGSANFAVSPEAPASYSETSAVDQSGPITDTPGTFAAFTSPALTKDTVVVGIPKVTVNLSAPTFAQSQSQSPGGMLVLFAKLYDVAPDGSIVLPNRLIAPVRIPDVSKPVTIALPGIAHRFAKGDKLELVLASSDAAYKNNTFAGPVTVGVDPKTPSTFSLPVLGDTIPAPVAAPAGSQSPGAGLQSSVKKSQAASLPAQCASKRSFVIHLKSVKRPDRIVSATVTVNGKRVKVAKGRHLHARITLKGLPKGVYRVAITVRTKRGKVLRSARTYHACKAGPKAKHRS